ncbi:hypothetical protein M0R45_024180 [Rubus argutus]|uniref:Uncharacterized protein n=1 Tax=Rubus argutus TaxID=59490 RepID=A0AAW1WSB6_RUBAR
MKRNIRDEIRNAIRGSYGVSGSSRCNNVSFSSNNIGLNGGSRRRIGNNEGGGSKGNSLSSGGRCTGGMGDIAIAFFTCRSEKLELDPIKEATAFHFRWGAMGWTDMPGEDIRARDMGLEDMIALRCFINSKFFAAALGFGLGAFISRRNFTARVWDKLLGFGRDGRF